MFFFGFDLYIVPIFNKDYFVQMKPNFDINGRKALLRTLPTKGLLGLEKEKIRQITKDGISLLLLFLVYFMRSFLFEQGFLLHFYMYTGGRPR
jgi:hypothetical protein